MTKNRGWFPHKEPWHPADYDEDLVHAIRAFEKGAASDGQQKVVWDWLMYVTGASEAYADLSFRPGIEGERATTFAEGKRFVGLQVRKMLSETVLMR